MNGGFNPLKGFLSQADHEAVVAGMRLADGTLWPMPINLDVSEAFAASIEPGQDIALRDAEGVILAIMSVTDRWTPDKSAEAKGVFGADDIKHPAINYLHHRAGPVGEVAERGVALQRRPVGRQLGLQRCPLRTGCAVRVVALRAQR